MTVTRVAPIEEAPAVRGARVSRRALLIAAVVVAVLVLAAVWIVGFSSVLGAKTIEVRGTRFLSSAQIRSAAAIRAGSPLSRLDGAAVARRVEALPEVASASVRAAYPSTVVITVVERAPLGYVESGSAFTLVDGTGDQFRTVAARPSGLPLFAFPNGPSARATGQAIAGVSSVLPDALRARLRSIQAFDPSSISLLLTDGRIVRWGSDDRDADKARILSTLLAQPGSQFDVSNPDLPFSR